MEELQDAIEDAQYVNAISTVNDGPRPVLAWEIPTEEQLEEWKINKKKSDENAFEFEWTVHPALGLFLFSAYLKEERCDFVRINFVEEILRWRRRKPSQTMKHVHAKRIHARQIAEIYLFYDQNDEVDLPMQTEIDEYDLERPPSNLGLSEEEFQHLYNDNFGSNEKSLVGLNGPILQSILHGIRDTESGDELKNGDIESPEAHTPSHQSSGKGANTTNLPDDLFDKAEAVVMESLRREYWDSFCESKHYKKLLNFLWFQDRPIVPEDFFTMRVLGRGGFGLVTACKKGTSGKLYAMKIMSKKRIKMKKALGLALHERAALAAVQSPFVVNLKYSFHSKDDVFLILDLMAGGDLGFHLHQSRKFSYQQCVYYAARIMLGLQALHDNGYVYRDLKPENCLLAEDGRVKLTDFGLATKVTPYLHGAAGTRGYWAPEMLRRDARGKRMPYGHTVDWFSFGCCVAEFISGTNPFRSEAALKFGRDRGHEKKESALDCATLEMEVSLDPDLFDAAATDFCSRLLDKNEDTRLGNNGCDDIMSHAWFRGADWEKILSDRKKPPFVPATDVNAASQSEIGTFAEDKAYKETVITEKDEEAYRNWDWTNPHAFAAEVIEFLIYERETGEPLVPQDHNAACCCVVS